MIVNVLENALIGRAGKPAGPFSADVQKLLAPFEHVDSKGYCFCVGCGALLEIGEKSTAAYLKLAKKMDPTSSDSIAEHYVEIKSCRNCGVTEIGVEIKKIPQLKRL